MLWLSLRHLAEVSSKRASPGRAATETKQGLSQLRRDLVTICTANFIAKGPTRTNY